MSEKAKEILRAHIKYFVIASIISITSLCLMVTTYKMASKLDTKFSHEHLNDIQEFEADLISINVTCHSSLGSYHVKSIDIIGKVILNEKERKVNLQHITKNSRGYTLDKDDFYRLEETKGGYHIGDNIKFYGYKDTYSVDEEYLISRVSGSRLGLMISKIFMGIGLVSGVSAINVIYEEYKWKQRNLKKKEHNKDDI